MRIIDLLDLFVFIFIVGIFIYTIKFFIKNYLKDYYRKKYYRRVYTDRDIQEFIRKFPYSDFCVSTYEPDPEMAYNVYGKKPMTKKKLQTLLDKLEHDGIVRCRNKKFKEKTYKIISESKAKLLEDVYRSSLRRKYKGLKVSVKS